MKNTFGQNVAVTIFGESHGEYIGAVLDGLSPGILVNEEFIEAQLTKRRPSGKISTSRREKDKFIVASGVFHGKTTGTPITILIPNENTKSGDYEKTKSLIRPSHADYTANCKYHGYEDFRGGGHFSGRLTAPLVAVGAIAIDALKSKHIYIGTHIKSCGGIDDRDFIDIKEDINKLDLLEFPVLNEKSSDEMVNRITHVAEDGDSVGGILETAVIGMPKGVGEPWFDSIESLLSHGLFSIPAIKGVEFGCGFDFAQMTGSKANDSFYTDGENIYTKSNNNGGINGGITNGMPILFRCAVKPTPSIYKEQNTVDITTMKNATLKINGRHDPAIIHRARVVVDSLTALTLCDVLETKFGIDYFM